MCRRPSSRVGGGIANGKARLCHHHTLGLSKIDLGAVDLSVKEERVGSQDHRSEEEDDGKGNRSRASRRRNAGSRRNLVGGLGQARKDGVDVFASRGIGIEVGRSSVQVLFALGGHHVCLFADFSHLHILVVVVV